MMFSKKVVLLLNEHFHMLCGKNMKHIFIYITRNPVNVYYLVDRTSLSEKDILSYSILFTVVF